MQTESVQAVAYWFGVRGETVWRWGEHGEPEIRLSYRWLHADGSRVDQEGLRTPFPSDVEPGEAQVVPVHVVGPREPGGYRLELDLVDEYGVVRQGLISHHYWIDGDKVEVFSPPFRYVWPSELDLMARLAGMTLRERWAGWKREPFTGDSDKHVSVWQKPPAR